MPLCHHINPFLVVVVFSGNHYLLLGEIVLSPYTAALFVAVTNAASDVMVAVDDVVVVATTAIVLLGIY